MSIKVGDKDQRVRDIYGAHSRIAGNKKTSHAQANEYSDGRTFSPMTIHNMDSHTHAGGQNDADLQGGVINVWDAYIAMSHDLKSVMKSYNKNFLKNSLEYSVVDEMLEYIANMEDVVQKNGYKVSKKQLETIHEAKSQLYDIQRRRTEASNGEWSQIGTVGQMNGIGNGEYNVDILNAGNKNDLSHIDVNTIEEPHTVYEQLKEKYPVDETTDALYTELINGLEDSLPTSLKVGIGRLKGKAKKGTTGEYNRTTNEIRIGVGYPGSLSPTVAYVHELVHAATSLGLKDKNNYAIKRTLEDFANKIMQEINSSDQFTPSEKRDYIKWLSAAPAEEILSYGITDPKISNLLKSMPFTEREANNAFTKFIRFVKRIFRQMKMHVSGRTTPYSEADKLDYLYRTALSANRRYLKSDLSTVQKIRTNIKKMDKGISSAGKSAVDKYAGLISNNTNFDSINKDELGQAVNEVIKRRLKFDVINNRTLQSIKASLIKGQDVISKNLSRMSGKYRRELELATNSMKDAYVTLFNDTLGHMDDNAHVNMKKAILDTDAIELIRTHGYSIEQVAELMKDEKLLEKKIKELEAKVDNDIVIYEAKALAWFMLTGASGSQTQVMNTRQLMQRETANNNELLYNTVDSLVSLYAIQRSGRSTLKDGISMLKHDQSKNLVGALIEMRNMSDDMVFDDNSEDLKIKGYSKNDTDPNKDIMIIPANELNLINDAKIMGYEVINEDKHKVILYSKVPKATYEQGLIGITDERMRGHKEAIEEQEYVDAIKSTMIAAKNGVEPEPEVDPYDGMYKINPIYHHKNTQTIKRYVMAKDMMDKHMGLEQRIGFVSGSTAASVLRKNSTRNLNKEWIGILAQYNEEVTDEKLYANDTVILPPKWNPGMSADEWNAAKEHFKSQSKEMQEVANMIPSSMLRDLRNMGMDEFYIPNETKDVLFGFRELVIQVPTKYDGIISYDVKKLNRVLRIVDAYWKGLVSMAKKRIILFNPAVHYGNAVSNLILLNTHMPLKDIYKGFDHGVKNVEYYRKDMAELTRLAITGKEGTREYNKIQKKINDNPITETMDLGLFSFIADDITQEAINKHNIAEELVHGIIERAVNQGMEVTGLTDETGATIAGKRFTVKDLKEFTKRLWVTEHTPEGKGMILAMQYSDFLAKDTLYRYLVDKENMDPAKAAEMADDTFINYNINDSALLDYLNKTGIFPFSKFSIRIVRVAGNLLVEKPISVLSQMVMGYAVEDINSAMADNNIWVNNMLYPFKNVGMNTNPTDILNTPYSFLFR